MTAGWNLLKIEGEENINDKISGHHQEYMKSGELLSVVWGQKEIVPLKTNPLFFIPSEIMLTGCENGIHL